MEDHVTSHGSSDKTQVAVTTATGFGIPRSLVYMYVVSFAILGKCWG